MRYSTEPRDRIYVKGYGFLSPKELHSQKEDEIEIDNAKDIDIVMPMYNLIEYSDNYSKTSDILRQYYRNEPNDNLTDSESFKSKVKISGSAPDNVVIKDV